MCLFWLVIIVSLEFSLFVPGEFSPDLHMNLKLACLERTMILNVVVVVVFNQKQMTLSMCGFFRALSCLCFFLPVRLEVLSE